MDVGEAVWSASNLLCGSCNLSAHKLLEEDTDESIINNSDSSPTQIYNITTNPTSLHDPTTSENTNTPITIMDEKTAAKLYEQAMSGRFDDADSFPDVETPLPNDTTMVASNVSSSHESSSNSSTPETRERTLTDDTSNSGSVSKHTLGK